MDNIFDNLEIETFLENRSKAIEIGGNSSFHSSPMSYNFSGCFAFVNEFDFNHRRFSDYLLTSLSCAHKRGWVDGYTEDDFLKCIVDERKFPISSKYYYAIEKALQALLLIAESINPKFFNRQLSVEEKRLVREFSKNFNKGIGICGNLESLAISFNENIDNAHSVVNTIHMIEMMLSAYCSLEPSALKNTIWWVDGGDEYRNADLWIDYSLKSRRRHLLNIIDYLPKFFKKV